MLGKKYFVRNLTKGAIFISIYRNKELFVDENNSPIEKRFVEGSLSSAFPEGCEYLQENFSLKPGEKSSGLVLNSPGFLFGILLLQGAGKIFPDVCCCIEDSVSDIKTGIRFDLNLLELDKEYFVRNVYVEGSVLDFVVFKSKKSRK